MSSERLANVVKKLVVRCKTLKFTNSFQISRLYTTSGDTRVTKGLVIGVYEKEGNKDPKLTTSGEKFDDRVQGKVSQLIKECNITGHLGRGKVFNNIDQEYRSVAVIGMGRERAGFNELEMIDEGMENARVAAGVGARSLQLQGCSEGFIDSMEYPEQAAEGSALAVWRYHDNRQKKNRTIVPKLELYDSPDVDAWTRGLFKAESQNLARRLSDAPANQMTPTTFAQATVDALCPCGVTVEIRTMEWIEQQHLNSFLAIAKGSCEPPVLLEISYCGTAPEDKPILLLGKGMTFNSGGICLRPGKGMDEYRGSMAGAAVCVAAIRAAAALSLPINISAVIPLCENIPSDNTSFDISNNGYGPASSCLAAAILHELVPCVDWAHLDIRGVGMLTRYGTIPYLLRERMTGRPTRTLVQFLYQMACPDANK
ncbi:cytosol aminopeptidase-like isoform X2 [Haematobia irritans]|uniref:cytosol aminopeptidase-like isoform X2 n=1 Tax=Haematobia irritans TaxID=7368 RepID=UPI003F4FA7B6